MPAYNKDGVLCLRISEYAEKHCRVPHRVGQLMRQGRIPWELINGIKHIRFDVPYPERKPYKKRRPKERQKHCGRNMHFGWKFCPRCGERLP